jgi:hypothetical protein
VYDKPSQKIEAFRKRLETAGFLRKEVLVQKKVWLVIQDIAKRKGVSTVDAASGLLEHGLTTYMKQCNEVPARPIQGTLIFADESISKVAGGLDYGEPEANPVEVDPIERFLEKRKEIASDNENN